MFKKQNISFIFFILFATPTKENSRFNFIVWDVGQGSWSTYIQSNTCLHFDMGGEKASLHELKRRCGNKKNKIMVTHLDWDHIRFIRYFSKQYKHVCLFYPKAINKAWLRKIKPCSLPKLVEVISYGTDNKDRNSSSIVYLLNKKVLISGDSPIAEEKKWYRLVPRNLFILLLGHHGSYTSTSAQLLDWSSPQFAITSARKGKYGHPHAKVTKKLQKRKINHLTTERQGHLYFQLYDNEPI